jgi:hypothetical protein
MDFLVWLYWNTLGKLRNPEVSSGDIFELRSDDPFKSWEIEITDTKGKYVQFIYIWNDGRRSDGKYSLSKELLFGLYRKKV